MPGRSPSIAALSATSSSATCSVVAPPPCKQRSPTYRGEGPLEAWVWRIVVNTARNYRRDRRGAGELPLDLEAPSTNGHSTQEAGVIAAAVAALPERQRLVLFLRFYADLDYGSIATALDVSPGTVGATLSAARSALQQLLRVKEETA